MLLTIQKNTTLQASQLASIVKYSDSIAKTHLQELTQLNLVSTNNDGTLQIKISNNISRVISLSQLVEGYVQQVDIKECVFTYEFI